MEIETLNAMNEGFYLSLLTPIEVIMLLNIVLAIAGFAIYLASVAWLCFSEMRQPARRRTPSATEPPEPDEYDLLVTLACLDDMLERSSAPTLRDLRGAAEDLFANIGAEPESTSSNDRPPQQAA